MPRLLRWLKALVSWIVVVWSIGLGVLALSVFGTRELYNWQSALLALGMLVSGLVPILAAFRAMRSRKSAAKWCLVAALPIFLLWLANASRYRLAGDIEFAVVVVSMWLLVPGLFWLVTFKFRWPELLQSGFRGWRRQVAVSGAVLAVAVCVLYGAVLLAFRRPRTVPYRCESTSVVTSPIESDHAMFLAHRLFPGHKPDTLADYYGFWRPLWSLAVVDHEYWGLPWWKPQIILLPNSYDGQFLVDATRDHELISGLIPLFIVRACGQSGELTRAEAQLRVLREGRPKSGIRIIGSILAGDRSQVPVAISGPQGEIRTTTDNSGVYDVSGLPAGRYRIRLDSSDPRAHRTDPECGGENGMLVPEGQVWGCGLVNYKPLQN